MLKFYANDFVSLCSALALVEAACASATNPMGLLDSARPTMSQRMASSKALCEAVGLKMSSLCIDRFGLTNPNIEISFKDLGDKVRELRNRIEDELSLCVLLQVEAGKGEMYESTDPFGQAVTVKFGSTAYDVEEASKCLALDRGTACVMHLMRVVEIAVEAIALGVGVSVAAVKGISTWEQLLNLIRDKVVANNKAASPPWTAAKGFFEGAIAYLHAVKDAWRNPAMHAEQKYTPEEAERIYVAIKNLMVHLAGHLDETGTFTP